MGLCPKPRWGLEAPDPHLKRVQSMRLKTRLERDAFRPNREGFPNRI